jgi:26S proteasome regulatory subunit N11
MDPEMMRMLMRMRGQGGQAGGGSEPLMDTAETVQISSLALLKMLKHGRAGVPMEVMGLMLGEYVDDYTVRVLDVFAMPQSGTGVSVEAVDPVFQQQMVDMLKQTGRPELVVGWYHSHPGFGCWLSGVDVNTAASFEKLNPRSVSVVVDPIQSVKGKVVIDAFRCISQQTLMMGGEPRQTTSTIGHLTKPSIQALIHGLNRHYYSIPIAYRKNELETKMLLNLHESKWTQGLALRPFGAEANSNETILADIEKQSAAYAKMIVDEDKKTLQEVALQSVGKVDPKKRLEADVNAALTANLGQCLGAMLDKSVF